MTVVVPTRCKRTGKLRFSDRPEFQPNLTPGEVLKMGSFGGGYFRDIYSGVAKKKYKDTWKELPKEWIEGLNVKRQLASDVYRLEVNNFKVNCGAKADKKTDPFGLDFWESSQWIQAQDPYGWFQWYCRFFQGRRSPDDDRQVSRWCKCAGPTGRWRNNLITKVANAGKKEYSDPSISPVVRQTLQHWGYKLTEDDYLAGLKRRNGSTAGPMIKKKSKKDEEREAKAKKEDESKRKRESDSARDNRVKKRRRFAIVTSDDDSDD